MDPRRQETHTAASTTPTTTVETPAPPKPASPMAEAVKLGAALAKIDKRELGALTNAKARYQAERDALLSVASEKAKRILEEAGRE